jgi:hypothetical protein
MDSSLITPLIVNAGVAGLVIVLVIFKVLVPSWYVKKLEAQNDILTSTAERAVGELALANQLVGELRAIALQRAGPMVISAAVPGQGGAGATPTLAKEA